MQEYPAFPAYPAFSSHAYSPAAVGWKRPFQHLNPTSVDIYTFGRGVHAISGPSFTECPKAFSRGGIGTYRGRIALDRRRCTSTCRHVNVLCEDRFGYGIKRISLGLEFPPSREGPHLYPDARQEL